MFNYPIVSISKHDWSLHRKGPADQARHTEKVKEAIKDRLPEIVSEEAIITSDGKTTVKIPMRSLELPHFRFDLKDREHVGQGSGDSKVGDDLGPAEEPPQAGGRGKRAGDQPGIDYYEAEITMDELAELIFADFGLPNLQEKKAVTTQAQGVRFDEVRKKGIMPNLDKRRTVYESIKRRAKAGDPTFKDLRTEDLRFRTWNPEVKRESNAAVIAMRDVSGSMGEFEKYITRTFYFWMVRFLRTKYHNVHIVFITHHAEAQEVNEEAFFRLGESGGTKASSAYRLALDIIQERYDPASWNIYPFHFSDGENWGDVDNRLCLELVGQLLQQCNQFGYGEIHAGSASPPETSASTLMSAFSALQDPKFLAVSIKDKADVYPALQSFFGPRPPRSGEPV